MNLENQLNGKWEFVGSQRHDDSEWVATESYVAGMMWAFETHMIGINRHIGVMVESVPTKREVKMHYSYDPQTRELRINTQVDYAEEGFDDEEPLDIYEVSFERENPTCVMLSIQNEPDCPPPYFRYILRKVE